MTQWASCEGLEWMAWLDGRVVANQAIVTRFGVQSLVSYYVGNFEIIIMQLISKIFVETDDKIECY